MSSSNVLTGLWFFLGGLVFGSFIEYWGHRLMHGWRLIGKVHRNHHATGVGQGVLLEYWEYIKPLFPLMFPMFLVSVPAGIGWFVGTNVFAFFSAFSHQLQHDNPQKCFWMPMPNHYVHHKMNMWHYNFGMALDVWDRVFRTYKPVEEAKWREGLDPELAKKSIFDIRWW